MNHIEAQRAINHLVNGGLVLPHEEFPGTYAGGDHDHIFENLASWDAYEWNPPEYSKDEFPNPDPNASPKPTWSELVRASMAGNILHHQDAQLRNLARITRQRITEAYGQDNHHDEIELRLGGRHTEAQDTERERLRTRYSIIKAWIESTDRTLTELEALDLTDNDNWTGETWPPVRGGL